MRIFAAAALLFLYTSAGAEIKPLPPLPPLTDPATNEHLPGKVVWADLFTNDVESARRFYERVFGWNWRVVTREPHHYGLLYNGSEAVAGIAHRDAPNGQGEYGRWVHFVSADDVRAIGDAIVAKGGEELLAYGNHAERGEFAIYAGPHQEVFGLIRSSSGDPRDYRARIGDWIWWQLFTQDVDAAVATYQALFGYGVDQQEVTSGLTIVHLSAHGYARAAVGPLPKDAGSSSTWIGFVRVGDMARSLAEVVENGGKVLLEPDPNVLESGVAVIADPLGALFGLLRWDYPEGKGEMRP